MVFNATFNNISAILWRSVSLGEETGLPKENHRPVASHWQTYITIKNNINIKWSYWNNRNAFICLSYLSYDLRQF